MLFSRFPIHIVGSVLKAWLDARALAKLDGALMNKAQRPDFLNLIRTDSFVLNCSLSMKSVTMVVWLLKREVRVSTVVFESGMELVLTGEYLRRFGNCVAHLRCLAQPERIDLGLLIALHCRGLRTLRLCSLQSVTNFVEILWYNPKLHDVRIELPSEPLVWSQQTLDCVQLRCLSIRNSLYMGSERVREFLASTRGMLTILNLDGCVAVTSDVLISFAPLIPHLRALGLGKLSITDDTFQKVIGVCPEIVHWGVSGNSVITNKGLQMLCNIPRLQSLNIGQCPALGDSALTIVGDSCAGSLRTLFCDDLDCKRSTTCSRYSVQAITDIVTKCTHLTAFQWVAVYPHSPPLQPAAFAAIWKNLVMLSLGGYCINDAFLQTVSTNCPALEILDLSQTTLCNSSKVTYQQKGLLAIFYGCRSLRVLALNVSMGTFEQLALDFWRAARPGLVISSTTLDTSFQVLTMPF